MNVMNAPLYINRLQTATIAASPFRQERKMPSNGTAAQVATEKKLYRIGEVSRLADLKPFVLRYWETEFPMLEPVKSSSGHRLYRQDDVDMVFRIKRLLYDEGFTIAGARRHLREHDGESFVVEQTLDAEDHVHVVLTAEAMAGRPDRKNVV